MNVPAAIGLICAFYTFTIVITVITRHESNIVLRVYPWLMWFLTTLLAIIFILLYIKQNV